LLGHTTIDGRPYYVRQMKNMKASMPVAFMAGPSFEFWAFACGALLARAHARSGDAAAIAGYCGDGHTLDRALADFAEAYGDQTERDHAALVQAIKRGRVESAGRPSPVSP
jgi:cytochrome c551/c552